MTRFYHKRSQRGSAFMLILLGIALFAGLSYAALSGSRSASSSLSNDQLTLAAQEIVQFTDLLAATVQKLILRGCTATTVNFKNSGAYVQYGTGSNPSSPADGTCDVFGTAGGNIQVAAIQSMWLGLDSIGPDNRWYVNSSNYVKDVGTDNGELGIVVRVTKPLCNRLNELSRISFINNEPPANGFNDSGAAFGGVYTASPYLIGASELKGQSAFCLNDLGEYKFYRVLISR